MSSQDYDSDDFTITREGVYGQEEIEVESADDEVTPEAMEEGSDLGNIENNNNLEIPLRKTKVSSAVWNLAEKIEGGAKCNLCEKTIKCERGNTSNIMGHLMSKHRERPEVKLLVKEQEAKKEKLKLKRLKKKKSLCSQPLIKNFSVR